MQDSLEILLHGPGGEDEGLARFEHGSLEVLVLDLELPDPILDELTDTERAVAMMVLDGASNAEIADARDVSVRTVANQLRSIFQKLGVCSRWDLTLLMTRRELEAQAAQAPAVLTPSEQPAPADGDEIHNSPETVQVLRTAYEHYGADFDAALREHDVFLREDGAITRRAYCQLFDALERGAGRPGLGLELPSFLPPGSFGLVEWLASSASTLAEAMRASSVFGSLAHPGAERLTELEGDRLVYSYGGGPFPPPRIIHDWSFAYTFAALSRNTVLDPIEVHVPYGDPGDQRAEDFFQCPVVYGSDATRLVLRREVGDAKVASGDPEVFELFRVLARLKAGQLEGRPVVYEAWAAIMRALRSNETPRLKNVARALDTSTRTLQRRLGAAELSFSGLVDAARLQRALGAIERGEPTALVEADEVVQRAFLRVAQTVD
jgi:DNA-binding CsgD family transcriptional regulator/AraC-like DNA-binding protein